MQIDKGTGYRVGFCSEKKGEFEDGILVSIHIDIHALGHENEGRLAFGGHCRPYHNRPRVSTSSDESTIGICRPDAPCNNVLILTINNRFNCEDFSSEENDTAIRRRLEAFERILAISAF